MSVLNKQVTLVAAVTLMLGLAVGGSEGASAQAAAPAAYHLLFLADRDGDLDVYAASIVGSGAVAVTHNSVNDAHAVLSPDGRSVALRRGRNIVVVGPSGSERVVGVGEPEAWSPDGRQLAVGGFRSWLAVIDVATRSVRRLRVPYYVYYAAWSPRGDQIAYVDSELATGVLDLRSGRSVRVPVISGTSALPVWSPSGGELTYLPEEGHVHVHALVRPRLRAVVGYFPAWSPDGNMLAYVRGSSGSSPGLYVLDVRTRRCRQLATGPVGPPVWSPAGDQIAYTRAGVVKVQEADGGRPHVLPGSAAVLDNSRPRWSPDGRLLAFPVNGHKIVVADTRGGPAHVVGRGRHITIIGWSPGIVRGPRAPLLSLPPVEQARGNTLFVRGVVTEIAADGGRVALLVEQSRIAMHASVWRVGATRPTDIRNPSTFGGANAALFSNLTLNGAVVTWLVSYCGNDCYESTITAVLGSSRPAQLGDEQPASGNAKHLAPALATAAGILVRLADGTLHVSAQDSSHIVRAPTRIIDFDLTSAGLFYAYNMRSGAQRGRVVFVPLANLH